MTMQAGTCPECGGEFKRLATHLTATGHDGKPVLAVVDSETPEEASPNRPPCECGCGGFPKGKKSRFIPGHDAKLHSRQKAD